MGFADLVKLKLRELEEPRFNAELSGAHIYDKAATSPGYNLFDGRLIDMEGNVLKNWKARYLGIILPDGRYLAQEYYESPKWGMYTREDRVIWEKETPIHHDIAVTPDDTIVTFTKEMRPYKGRNVDFCVIAEYSMEGREISRWSTWEHLAEIKGHHRPLELDRPKMFFIPETARRKDRTPWGGNYDYYRLNSIQILPETPLGAGDARFRKGNWLISFRHGSMLFILDKDTKRIVWKCLDRDVRDSLEGQHAPQLLSSGKMLVFDNGRYRGWSRIFEMDPVTREISWEYRAEGFYTLSQGYVQRLPNGNTLVTESERGRAFEITPEKRIVWEYYHPEEQDASNSRHSGSFGRRQWIYRMVRYPKEMMTAL